MRALTRFAAVALAFVHFKSPADDTPLYVTNEDAPAGATQHEDGFARDAQGDKLAIGVRVFGGGSKEARSIDDAIANEMIARGRKALTGALLRENATKKLALCTQEFVNFGYALTEGGDEIVVTPATDETTRARVAGAFYDDVRFVAFREQVEKAQGDIANFTPKA